MQDAFGIEISKGAIQRTYYAAQASAANPDAGVRENAKFIYNARLKRVNRGNVSKGIGTKVVSAGRNLVQRRIDRLDDKAIRHAEQYFKPGDKLGRQVRPTDFREKPEKLVGLSEQSRPEISSIRHVAREEGLKGRVKEALGFRTVDIGIKDKGKSTGFITGTVLPTGRVRIDHLRMHRNASLQQTSGLINQLTQRAPQAKGPGIYFRAGSYDTKAAKAKGRTGAGFNRAVPGVRYVPGVGYGKAGLPAFYPEKLRRGVEAKFQFAPGTTKETKKEVRRHIIRAATGKEIPSDFRKLSPEAQAYMRDKEWQGHIRGRTPFLGKTKIAAGGVAGGGVVVGGNAAQKKFEEREHPRGFGGHFRNKGYKSAYKSVLDRQNKVSKSSEVTNQIGSDLWKS